MIRTVLKKIIDMYNIHIIKKSKYFDEAYYLKNNQDIQKSDILPLKHYYYIGWKEGRNPSSKFDNDLYISANSDYNINMNPVLHYMKYGRHNPNIIGPETKFKKKTKEIINKYFDGNQPFKTIPSLQKERLNVVFNDFDENCFFGGKATALLLATIFASQNNYILRIISQNPNENVFKEFCDLFKIKITNKVEFFSLDSKEHLEISPLDHFLCTMWNHTDSILNTPEITGKIFYLIQEIEPNFYDQGDYHLRCENTLKNQRLLPIINSKLLYDYFINNNYENIKNNGIYFEPAFSKQLIKPSKNSFMPKNKYNLFFYARPSHQRNLFYFGLETLNEAFLRGILNPKEWTIYVAGDNNTPKFELDCNIEIIDLGIMKWKEYYELLSNIDLCYSLIYSPRVNYTIFDSVTAGAVCVTNKYLNKQNLDNYSKNILTSNLTKEEMLNALETGAKLAKNSNLRKQNYLENNINEQWEDSFKLVIQYMNKHIKDDKNV